MSFKNFFLIFTFIFIPICLNSRNIIGVFCENQNFEKKLENILKNKYSITKEINKADLLICGGVEYIKKCQKYNKKIIAVNIYNYEIEKIKSKDNMIFLPIDFRVEDIVNFLKKRLKFNKICIFSHYLRYSKYKGINFFHVKNIGEVPFIVNKALKQCEIIISVPDDVVFNYFSTRFIFKKVILNGKFITGFHKEMLKLGAIFSFEIDIDKYIKKIVKTVDDFFNKKNFKNKIIFPKIDEFKIYKNIKILKTAKNEF